MRPDRDLLPIPDKLPPPPPRFLETDQDRRAYIASLTGRQDIDSDEEFRLREERDNVFMERAKDEDLIAMDLVDDDEMEAIARRVEERDGRAVMETLLRLDEDTGFPVHPEELTAVLPLCNAFPASKSVVALDNVSGSQHNVKTYDGLAKLFFGHLRFLQWLL